MNTRSYPTGDPRIERERGKPSAIIRRATLRRQRGAVERWSALVVLFVSFLGTIVAFAGGWPAFIQSLRTLHPSFGAIGGAVALQALLTYLEWHYYDQRAVAWSARIVDATTTAIGFAPLFFDRLLAYLASYAVPSPFYATWTIVGIASLAIAWYPESRLVD